ncbi:oxidoreductase [Vibrio breoganii]|uniref:Gfo/Idh/MocA family protein n=1 Tax=Vibrio breoganii TaxID=553239 RepID=UPI000C821E95|nr:Gfo/Idh/MocA family oxidoreductase [Vibrio breoganii]MDN3717662.1 Gfo/Idh/MocA family oxidoreductase [Vibrio breoganii]PMF70250.1 oxidoreductase [Vibrio breoganii]PMG01620.1 oxidoreductase [Vibrio breoganii]PMG41789.1 oxidoreductase [Vibrio breoganii]PMG83610.1 oxidoreductase [Vibrio breoganii]
MNQKVLVFGTGFAGQGHAKAFRDAGAEVVGIVGRTEHVVTQVAKDLDIPYSGTNWALALEMCKPDIVSIATPGGAHVEAIKEAISFGCHIFCDKPLTESGETALEIYRLAKEKGVKTAFASSFRYMPEIMHAKQLVAAGAIGEPTEVECISHFNLDRNIPFGWSHRTEAGGGRLNNNFTHLLSIVTSVVGEKLLSISGEVRNDMPKAPVVEGVHNFTERRNFIPKDINDPNLEWRACDVEWSYTVMAQIESRIPAANPVSVLFKHGGLTPRFNEDHIVFHGSQGSIYIKGHYGDGPLYLWKEGQWQEVALPSEITEQLPAIECETQRSWTHLATQLVKDVSGIEVEPYQTFEDGCRYQLIIDLIRKNDRWVDVTDLL